jgi:hypothetical protein
MKVGAPLFASFAKGGHEAACSADFDFAESHGAGSILPALAKNARTGHPHRRGASGVRSLGHPPTFFGHQTVTREPSDARRAGAPNGSLRASPRRARVERPLELLCRR